MEEFAALVDALVYTRSRNEKLRLIAEYLRSTPDPDRGWALAALSDGLDFPAVKSSTIRNLMKDRVDPVLWTLSRDFVGDTAETASLLWPAPDSEPDPPGVSETVELLSAMTRKSVMVDLPNLLDRLDASGRYALLKLATGGMRIGVSSRLAKTAFAQAFEVSVEQVEEYWHGLEPPYDPLFAWAAHGQAPPDIENLPTFRPFMLAHPLEDTVVDLADYAAEWKWDGIRAQLIARPNGVWVWSRGEEPMAGRFPEVEAAAGALPEAVLDGELVAWHDKVLPFSQMQRRIQRKTVGEKLLREVPVAFLAYDLIEYQGRDWRARPLRERRAALETLVADAGEPALKLSPLVDAPDWPALAALRADSREHQVEGLMLKHRDSPYRSGRVRGDWWKWKIDPLTLDAVLLYAQPGHGRRANLYTDYTLAVPDGDGYVPIAKAYSGLSDQEIGRLDRWIRRNTVEKFGPVRSVQPHHVFEIAFEGIQPSPRHKSGIALRFPRIARWRQDLTPDQADSLTQVKELLDAYGS